MFVVKRDGRREKVYLDKISSRIEKLCFGLDMRFIQPFRIVKRVVEGLVDGISTVELDTLAAETAAALTAEHPSYALLAARIAISNLQKQTLKSFSQTMQSLFDYSDPKTGECAGLIDKDVHAFVQANAAQLDGAINYHRDFSYEYFGFKTLEKGYLMRMHDRVVERPQHLLMRVAVGIHHSKPQFKADGPDRGEVISVPTAEENAEAVNNALETYELLSQGFFIHASPTLFNAGTPFPQLSSCFLLQMQEDSIDGIYETLKQCAQISKHSGGIGLSATKVRAKGSYIHKNHGIATGIVPMLRVFDQTSVYVNQGGKRKGAFAVYMEPWHADIFSFLALGNKQGVEELTARNLFLAIWSNDIFMRRVEADEQWSLFCPNECPGLDTCYGEAFDTLYEQYEKAGKARKVIRAQELWSAILKTQIETGTPYMTHKDTCNRKSNQKNCGMIFSENLCTEVCLNTSIDEVAVCNLASLSLPRYVEGGVFNHQRLYEVVQVIVRNLDRIIDINFYPVPEAKRSNTRMRPEGIGIQGLADLFAMLRLPYDSDAARTLNKDIAETIYYAALTASKDLAKVKGPYEGYAGCPASQGTLQFDWCEGVKHSGRWDWAALKREIQTHGLRNSVLISPMPTASTSSIVGNQECFEVFTSNLYLRRVLSGEFVIVNKHLTKELIELGLWDTQMKNDIIAANGSVANIARVPEDLKAIYRTVWEVPLKSQIDMAVDRSHYVDQSQSLNIHLNKPSLEKLSKIQMYGFKSGLKTTSYYVRTQAEVDSIKVTVQGAQQKSVEESIRPQQQPTTALPIAKTCAPDATRAVKEAEETCKTLEEQASILEKEAVQRSKDYCKRMGPNCVSCGS